MTVKLNIFTERLWLLCLFGASDYWPQKEDDLLLKVTEVNCVFKLKMIIFTCELFLWREFYSRFSLKVTFQALHFISRWSCYCRVLHFFFRKILFAQKGFRWLITVWGALYSTHTNTHTHTNTGRSGSAFPGGCCHHLVLLCNCNPPLTEGFLSLWAAFTFNADNVGVMSNAFLITLRLTNCIS